MKRRVFQHKEKSIQSDSERHFLDFSSLSKSLKQTTSIEKYPSWEETDFHWKENLFRDRSQAVATREHHYRKNIFFKIDYQQELRVQNLNVRWSILIESVQDLITKKIPKKNSPWEWRRYFESRQRHSYWERVWFLPRTLFLQNRCKVDTIGRSLKRQEEHIDGNCKDYTSQELFYEDRRKAESTREDFTRKEK